MPDSPDFEQIARWLAEELPFLFATHRDEVPAYLAAQLRQVWHARPVPRCDQCRFWQAIRRDPARGDCRVFSDDPNIAEAHKWPAMIVPVQKATVAPFAGADGGGLITDADFGCVQWEQKP